MAAPTNSSEIGRQRQARLTVDGAGRSFARRTYSKQDEILAGIAPDRVRPRQGRQIHMDVVFFQPVHRAAFAFKSEPVFAVAPSR